MDMYTFEQYESFFDEAITALGVLPLNSVLGDEKTEVAENPALRLLNDLKTKQGEVAEFSSELHWLRLNASDLKSNDDNAYFLVRIPIKLVPRPGYLYTRLFCSFEFNPDSSGKRPTAYRLYPTDDWQTIIEAYQGLEVGIDNELKFAINTEKITAKYGPINAEMQAKLAPHISTNAGITLGRFDYRLQRPKILARGQGSPKPHWTLDGSGNFQNDLYLGIVIEVPSNVTDVTIAGALLAHRDFQVLMAKWRDIWERLKKYLSSDAQEFFENGAPLVNHQIWEFETTSL